MHVFVSYRTQSCHSDFTCERVVGSFLVNGTAITCEDKRWSPMEPGGNVLGTPLNETRLKICCIDRRISLELTFENATNIRELILEEVKFSLARPNVFRGLERLTHLVLRNLYGCKHIVDRCFEGLTNLRSLTITHMNELEHMYPGLLQPLVSLQSLTFRYIGSSSNMLGYTDYARVLGGITSRSFQTLLLYGIHSKNHNETQLNIDDLFQNGSMGASLKHLDIGRNYISFFKGSPSKALPVLEFISLAENVINGSMSASSFWKNHPRLTTLNISEMDNLGSFNETFSCSNLGNGCNGITEVTVGPRLEFILMRNTAVDLFNQFKLIDTQRVLKYVDISNSRCARPIACSVGSLHALEYFNLQNVNADGVDKYLFNKMPNLKVLLLGNNDIGDVVANDIENRLFNYNKQLQNLDLAGCNITEIPLKEFSNLQHLQNINLSGNWLRRFQVNLQTLTRIETLNLSHNNLTTLPLDTRTELEQVAAEKNVTVDISENPLQCLCDFVNWIHTSRVKFVNKDNTFCVDGNNSMNLLFDIESPGYACIDHKTDHDKDDGRSSKGNQSIVTGKDEKVNPLREKMTTNVWNNTLIISLSLTLVVIIIAFPVVIFVLRRYRWKMAFCCHRLRGGRSPAVAEVDKVYKRDAFICFNSNDRGWVCNDLLQHLEDNEISTVVHHRDFMPGGVLEDMIRESIDMCRYTVLVLSPDFLSSNWCLLEMHLARSRIISQERDVIVPIILREFPTSQLTRTLEGILSRSYIQWTDDPEGQVLFWGKLIDKLKRGGNIRPLHT